MDIVVEVRYNIFVFSPNLMIHYSEKYLQHNDNPGTEL